EQAEALLREADAVRWPQVDLGGTAARSRSSELSSQPGGGTANNFRLAASTAFELDFWGRLRRASEAARAQALATDYAREVVHQTVTARVVDGYFLLRTLDEQIVLTRDTLKSREESARLLRVRL